VVLVRLEMPRMWWCPPIQNTNGAILFGLGFDLHI